MRSRRILSLLFFPLLVLAIWLGWRNPPPAAGSRTGPAARAIAGGVAAASVSGESAAAATKTAQRREMLARFAYAQGWADPDQPAALAAFRAWTERFRTAKSADRAALLEEGVALARARRGTMRALIITDPQRALAVTVPAVVRRELPAEVLGELEARLAGKGEFALLAASPEPGGTLSTPRLHREVLLGGTGYTAHVYGRREPQTALDGVSLHGIALDGQIALHESPLRVLEPGEAVGTVANANCPVTSAPVAVVSSGAAANLAELTFAEEEGRVVEFCGQSSDMIELYAVKRAAGEEAAGPAGAPTTAAEPERPQSVGAKQVLVIRADFSDFPGEPISQTAALNVVGNLVRSVYEDMSYGKTTLNAVVTDTVYRLPQTGVSYATAGSNTQLHSDARAAAAANYTIAQFDRIIVVFPRLTAVSGSQINYGGLGQINATNIWINGPNSFTLGSVSHELGHTYGLLHSNLWRVIDGNPVSPNGTNLEYGDPFDIMASASVSGVTRDARHHFNAWQKSRLGWLPDTAVTTVQTTGTYRIYRFDHRDAVAGGQPLALRIFRDGVRWYWVGYRQNFATGTPQANGAQVVWGFNNRQGSQLLDLFTPGTNSNDATLPVGSTFTDSVTGVSIKTLARGGAEPAQYLDVEVTLPPVARAMVAAWGREGVEFYDDVAGLPNVPTPETLVPFDLAGVRAIAGGNQHAVALKGDGTVVAWGLNTSSQSSAPAGLTGVISVAAGGDVSGAVRSDGTVRLWGSGTSGQTTVPAGLSDVKQLAIGRNHVLALKNDGTVTAWGINTQGQATVPAGLADVIAVAAGAEISVALKRDGTVTGWGNASYRPPAGLTGITALASCGALTGGQFTVALRTNGTVTAWGANNQQQLNVPAGLNGVVAVAAGAFHALALKSDGAVVGWGTSTSLAATVPPSLPRSFALAASASAGFAIVGASVQFSAPLQDQVIALGRDVTFSAAASGIGALSYQWRKDGVTIPGATAGTLTLTAVAASAAGLYDVVVRDAQTTLASNVGRLTVNAVVTQEVSRIANLSIRTRAGTVAQTLIVGFVVGGDGTGGTKPLLVRGVGPTLGVFGVTGTLTDPQLEVFSSTGVRLFANDNWNLSDAGVFASVGAFALNANSRDAALYNGALPSAAYSAQVSGVGGATGVALAELYDVTPPATFGPAVPRLINVSARALSGTGADVLIAGFVIAGPGPKNVLIRAIGPTLSVFGVTGVLTDPKLELFNAEPVKLQENDDWATPVGGATPVTAATFAAVGAFGLVTTSRDAALLATLPPGAYTAQISGVGGTTGVALVEVYEAP